MGQMKLKYGLTVLCVALFVTACETTPKPTASQSSSGNYKIGTPYKVGGVWYYPKEQPNYSETGLASWYGPNFHGKKTANGETFDQNALSAAHKTLPMPVKVRVTNLENGRQIDVRVNDRGPFVKGRIIDLSSKAAELLDIKGKGTAMVKVEYLGRLDNESFYSAKPVTPSGQKQVASAPIAEVSSDDLSPPPGVQQAAPRRVATTQPTARDSDSPVRQVPVSGTPHMYVQAAAFLYRDNAVKLQGKLVAEGHQQEAVKIDTASVNGTQFYRVRIGPLQTVASADTTLDQVIGAGHSGARIVID